MRKIPIRGATLRKWGELRHARWAILPAALVLPTTALARDRDVVQWAPTRGVERSWRLQADYLSPKEANRPIDVVTVTASHVWRFPFGVEAALGLGVLNANGQRIEVNRPPLDSGATGALFGGGVRLAPMRVGPVEPFVEGGVHFLYTAGHPFPAEGSSVNGLVRWGGGVNVHLSDRLAVEGGYHGAHISNGGGLVSYNPAWNGRGGFVGLSWRSNK